MSGVKAADMSFGGKSSEKRSECSILDFTSQAIEKIEIIPNADPAVVILDKNNIANIENLVYYQHLEQVTEATYQQILLLGDGLAGFLRKVCHPAGFLRKVCHPAGFLRKVCHPADFLRKLSIGDNQLLSMTGVSQLTNLTVLNLPGNKINSIEGVKNLTKLQWLNLSKNSIKSIENVQSLTGLQHLDLSDNTLLLHGNDLVSLRTAPSHLPVSLTILSLAANGISDLTEVRIIDGSSTLLLIRSLGEGFSPNALGQPGTAVIDEQSLRAEHIHQYLTAQLRVAKTPGRCTCYKSICKYFANGSASPLRRGAFVEVGPVFGQSSRLTHAFGRFCGSGRLDCRSALQQPQTYASAGHIPLLDISFYWSYPSTDHIQLLIISLYWPYLPTGQIPLLVRSLYSSYPSIGHIPLLAISLYL
ncbi:hypothetical protein LSH36_719g01032 [Paralvinella palmiformis]|uniref:Uncharacterized protein n=1 Tax=Paralvinella palmiformis TaxID=53620 RepID=A0AAD9MTK0_9ANNE|nr:hypothetical protein LSH36_719g01032 [Paralvinella palmiformis]